MKAPPGSGSDVCHVVRALTLRSRVRLDISRVGLSSAMRIEGECSSMVRVFGGVSHLRVSL
eukprot:2531577-Rhodomonas_salina.2